MSSTKRMLKRGASVLIRLFSSSSASASERTTVVSMRAIRDDHVADPIARRCRVALVEVARDALLQVARLADVEHGAGGVEVAVDAGQVRQRRHFGEQALAPPGGSSGARRGGSLQTAASFIADDCAARRWPTLPPPSIIARCAGTSSAASSTTSATSASAGAWPPTSPAAARRCACAIDDARALAWMAPGGAPGVEVVRLDRRPTATRAATSSSSLRLRPARRASSRGWRARAARRSGSTSSTSAPRPTSSARHGLPSPQLRRPGRRPDDVVLLSRLHAAHRRPAARAGPARARDSASTRAAWLRSTRHRAAAPASAWSACSATRNAGSTRCSTRWRASRPCCSLTPGRPPTRSPPALGAAGRAAGCVRRALPLLTQADYDRLLWSCDLNFVRGEDSFVRAQWAGAPFVWQVYRAGRRRARAQARGLPRPLPGRRAERWPTVVRAPVPRLERPRRRGRASCRRPDRRGATRCAALARRACAAQDDLTQPAASIRRAERR